MRGRDDVAKHEHRRFGGPLQVVDHEEDGPVALACRFQPARHRFEEAEPLGIRVREHWRWKVRDPFRKIRQETGQVAAVPAEALRQPTSGPLVHEVAKCLGEGLVGDRKVLVAAPGEHQRSIYVGEPGQFRRQSCLAHAWLATEQRDRPLAGGGLLPQPAELLELVVAPDE